MARFAFRVKSKSGQQVVEQLTPQNTMLELKNHLSTLTNIPVDKMHVLYGYPPKELDLSAEDKSLETTGISNGETLIVEEKVDTTCNADTSGVSSERENQTVRHHIAEEQLKCPGILMKQVVPSDNSCLFTSIGFVLSGTVDTSIVPNMRQVIAEVVSKDEDTYCEATLGKPNKEYCKWILKSDSWGGAIELAVLSQYYGIEMAVVDTLNAIINRFGEDRRYGHRVFLLFDGIHYDPLYLEPLDGGDIQTIFPIEDEQILKEAEQLAREAKSSRQYTDVNKFTLKCLDCCEEMTGQTQAQQHAKATGHMNFGEV